MRTALWLLLVQLFLTAIVSPRCEAQLPSLFRNKVEAKQDETYWLTEQDGPWLIMCASFAGENGLHQANDLVYELRSQHKLKAMVFKKKFDFAEIQPGIGYELYVNELGQEDFRQKQMEFANTKDFEEIAVVVGDFPSMDDRRAADVLDKIKHIKPESLAVSETEVTSQRMGVWREIMRQVNGDPKLKSMGPMRQAFLIPNPLLPEDFFNQNIVDTVIIRLNKDEKYSLLNCPKPFSVRVATFRGDVTFDLNEMEKHRNEESRLLKLNKPLTKSKLAEAAEKAQRLTAELRKLGVEAYEFHDRYESYVCVGSFDWVVEKNAQGMDVWNDAVVKTLNDYRANVESFPNMPNAARPKTLPSLKGTGIVFDVQPVPVQVPRIWTNR